MELIMTACKTVRIKPTDKIQCPGHDFVEINETDFNPDEHELYETDDKGVTKAEIVALLTTRGIAHNPRASKAALMALVPEAELPALFPS
jgi:hypothetical protein